MEIVSTKTRQRPPLTDDERGQLIVSAACYGIIWGVGLGTFFVTTSWLWSPDTIRSALWWYPFGFVVVFLRMRHKLLERANEIIAYNNKHPQA